MCGDGSFLMNVQELETAVRYKLPIIIIVWCDREYGLISLKQIDEFGKKAFTEFTNPDFEALAQSFGAVGYHVKTTEEFPKILEKAKQSKDLPVVISIDVDYSRNHLLLEDRLPEWLTWIKWNSIKSDFETCLIGKFFYKLISLHPNFAHTDFTVMTNIIIWSRYATTWTGTIIHV